MVPNGIIFVWSSLTVDLIRELKNFVPAHTNFVHFLGTSYILTVDFTTMNGSHLFQPQ
jgi:hypothetical protein